MTRSLKKGPYVDERLLKKIEGKKPIETGIIKTWSRACVISPEMVGFVFGVHNGKHHIEVLVKFFSRCEIRENFDRKVIFSGVLSGKHREQSKTRLGVAILNI